MNPPLVLHVQYQYHDGCSSSISVKKHWQININTGEPGIKEPIFIRTLRLKFNILNPLNKNLSEADTGGGSYITGFMSSEFLKAFKNSRHSDENSSRYK